VGQFKVDEDDAYLTYHADTWKVLRSWLTLVDGNLDATGTALLSDTEAVTPELAAWLAAQDFTTAWERIRSHCTDPAQRRSQFHGWFDAFRTLKLAHHLRDSGLSRQDLFESLAKVMAWLEIPSPMPMTPALRHDISAQRSLLQELREKAGG
jgi:hypothetical protein